jgi:hypothetical protein
LGNFLREDKRVRAAFLLPFACLALAAYAKEREVGRAGGNPKCKIRQSAYTDVRCRLRPEQRGNYIENE